MSAGMSDGQSVVCLVSEMGTPAWGAACIVLSSFMPSQIALFAKVGVGNQLSQCVKGMVERLLDHGKPVASQAACSSSGQDAVCLMD